MTQTEPLGILAGAGRVPMIAARIARRNGRSVVAVQLAETEQDKLSSLADHCLTESLGQVGAILDFYRKHDVREVLFIGKVPKQLHFAEIQFDEVALSMLARLPGRTDSSIFGVIANEMTSRGMIIASQIEVLSDLLAPNGHLAGPPPSQEMLNDIQLGLQAANRLTDLDIGQTVVVARGAVVAVEAFEHTDATIQRAGKLAGTDLVAVKVARPQQDPRFDVPTVGAIMLATLRRAGGVCLAVEAGKTLMIEPKRMQSYAQRYKITLMGISRDFSGGNA